MSIPVRQWSVWGDDHEPIATDLTEAQAKGYADELARAGHHDVYAESNDGDTYEPPDFTTELP